MMTTYMFDAHNLFIALIPRRPHAKFMTPTHHRSKLHTLLLAGRIPYDGMAVADLRLLSRYGLTMSYVLERGDDSTGF